MLAVSLGQAFNSPLSRRGARGLVALHERPSVLLGVARGSVQHTRPANDRTAAAVCPFAKRGEGLLDRSPEAHDKKPSTCGESASS
jgi:hypothetical protein